MTDIIAQRETLGSGWVSVPTLKASNIYAAIVARLQRAIELSTTTQRFSLGYNICRLWRLNPSFQTASKETI
jgi:hypothetical protein